MYYRGLQYITSIKDYTIPCRRNSQIDLIVRCNNLCKINSRILMHYLVLSFSRAIFEAWAYRSWWWRRCRSRYRFWLWSNVDNIHCTPITLSNKHPRQQQPCTFDHFHVYIYHFCSNYQVQRSYTPKSCKWFSDISRHCSSTPGHCCSANLL